MTRATQIPDFARLDFDAVLPGGVACPERQAMTTPEGLTLRPAYTAEALAGVIR